MKMFLLVPLALSLTACHKHETVQNNSTDENSAVYSGSGSTGGHTISPVKHLPEPNKN